jgi:molybdate transport system permease protein
MTIPGLQGSRLKPLSIFFSLALASCIFLVLLSIVTYPPVDQLVDAACSEEIIFSVRLSLITATVSTAVCILVSIPSAYALSRYDVPGKNLVNTLINIPMALPPLVAGVGLLILLGLSPLGQGITSVSGIEFVFAPAGIVVAQCFMNAPYLMRIMRSTFDSVSPRYEHVAKSLGCTDLQAFLRVTLPMSTSGLLAGTVITWSKAIGEFGAVLIIAGATRYRTEILPTSVFLNMSCGELDMAIAAASVMILISVASLYAFEKFGNKVNVY